MLKDYGKRETRRTEEARRWWALKDEYAQEILRLFPWSWWVTITFRGSPAPSSWSGMTRIRIPAGHQTRCPWSDHGGNCGGPWG